MFKFLRQLTEQIACFPKGSGAEICYGGGEHQTNLDNVIWRKSLVERFPDVTVNLSKSSLIYFHSEECCS